MIVVRRAVNLTVSRTCVLADEVFFFFALLIREHNELAIGSIEK
jgi:hypothetical protein